VKYRDRPDEMFKVSNDCRIKMEAQISEHRRHKKDNVMRKYRKWRQYI
jgi:hypothetical protein